MFANECLGELTYEATTAAIFMAGLFLSFLVDYVGARFILWRQSKKDTISSAHVDIDTERSTPTSSDITSSVAGAYASHIHRTPQANSSADEKLAVVVLEAGIIFHSICMCPPSFFSFSSYWMLTRESARSHSRRRRRLFLPHPLCRNRLPPNFRRYCPRNLHCWPSFLLYFSTSQTSTSHRLCIHHAHWYGDWNWGPRPFQWEQSKHYCCDWHARCIERGNFGLGRDCGNARERLDAWTIAACRGGEDGGCDNSAGGRDDDYECSGEVGVGTLT
jgi:hypothetical protein